MTFFDAAAAIRAALESAHRSAEPFFSASLHLPRATLGIIIRVVRNRDGIFVEQNDVGEGITGADQSHDTLSVVEVFRLYNQFRVQVSSNK